jgi:hypothetical protein
MCRRFGNEAEFVIFVSGVRFSSPANNEIVPIFYLTFINVICYNDANDKFRRLLPNEAKTKKPSVKLGFFVKSSTKVSLQPLHPLNNKTLFIVSGIDFCFDC